MKLSWLPAAGALAACGGFPEYLEGGGSAAVAKPTAQFPSTWSGESSGAVAASTPTTPPEVKGASSSTPALPVATFVRGTPQPAAFALVVGIDKYRDVVAAPGARNDAQRFAQVVRQTLGIPESHVHVALDERATKNDLETELAWLKSSATNGSRLYFFFSGHGAPDTEAAESGTPYLVPYDGNPKSLSKTSIALATVMSALGSSRAKDALVVLDSCFSGQGQRSLLPPGARPLMRVKEEAPATQVALFSASGANEIAGPASDAPLGAFTKFVTEGLGNGSADGDGDGDISLAELGAYVTPRVQRDAKRSNRDQTPSITVGSGIGDAKSFDVAWGLPTK